MAHQKDTALQFTCPRVALRRYAKISEYRLSILVLSERPHSLHPGVILLITSEALIKFGHESSTHR
jgi:hypothetical protein